MKKIILLFLFIGSALHAQTVTSLFHENFDLPSGADSVSTNYFLFNPSSPPTTHLWNVLSDTLLRDGQFYHVFGKQYNQIYFETNSFSTIGAKPFILLQFDHIAKIYEANKVFIEVSVDGGFTWQDVDTNHYLGNSPGFKSNSFFNDKSYLLANDLWQSGVNTTPDSTWWVNEKFNISDLAYGTAGYANVKIRFTAEYILPSPQSTAGNPIFYAGGYIDNLLVEAYICEKFSPKLNFVYTGNFCDAPPIGKVVPASGDQFDVYVKAVDNEGNLTDVLLIYSIDNAAEDTVVMNGPNALKNAMISNAVLGSSVNWYIIARDSCGNTGRLPADTTQYYNFTVEILNNNCAFLCGNYNLISTFPWKEDFESYKWIAGDNGLTSGSNAHRGTFPIDENWIVGPPNTTTNQNKFAWSIANGATGTNNTGPGANHTPGGSKYLYTEGSLTSYVAGTNISSTTLTTTCIDLRQVNDDLIFEYYHHFFGADINQFRIDIDTGQMNTSWWLAYQKVVGETQTSSADPWKRSIVSLSPFKGKVIKIRLVAFKSGSGPLADFSIDDLSIYKAGNIDAGLASTNMVDPVPCGLTSAENVKIIISNFGSDTLTVVPVAYQLNSGPVVRDTANMNLALGDTGSFSFSTTADFSATGVYILKAWTELPNDTVHDNDTIVQDNLYKSASTTSFPIVIDFESATPAFSLNSGNGLLNRPEFFMNIIDNSSNNGARWMIYDKSVKDINSGPLGGTNRRGKYLLFRDANGSSINDVARFKSNCLDFTGINNPVLSFKYHNFGSGQVKVYIKEEGASNWVQLATASSFGVSAVKDEAYRQLSLNLQNYGGKIVEILIEGSFNNDENIAIDDLFIFEKAPVDIAFVNESMGFYQGINTSLPPVLSFTLANMSSNITGANLTVKGEFTNCANGNVSGSFQSAPITTLPSTFNTLTVSKAVTYSNTLPVGTYSLKMWIELNGDTINNFNDTIWRDINIRQRENIPYFNDFETCNKELPKQGTFLEWSRAIPSKGGNMNSAHSGSYVMMISPGDDAGLEEEILLLPTFDNLDTIYGEELRFWHIFNMGYGNGYGKIEYFKNQAWHVFPNNRAASNWTDSPYGNNSDNGFSISPNWIKSTYPLDVIGMQNLSIRFRSNMDFNGISWLIDDLEIYVPPQNSASPITLQFASAPTVGNNPVDIKIKNTGAAPLSEVKLTTFVNGALQGTGNHSFTPVQISKLTKINVLSGINLTAGNNEIKIISGRPNNRTDAIPADDTLILNIFLPQDVNVLPYCEDFETNRAFINFNPLHQIMDTVWQYGLPAKNILNTTYSGVNAWFTSGGTYPVLADQFLYTAGIAVEKDKCYSLSFQHQFRTELNFDGGNVEYTLDSGATWQVFGDIKDTNWYNTPAVQALDAYKPGWSGSSGPWRKVEKITKFYDDGNVQFRFRFASNSTINLDGWVVDDFCFEELAGGCEYVSVDETGIKYSEMMLYPNPAHNQLVLISPVHIKEGVAFITDINGKRVMSIPQELVPNQPIELLINHLPPGMYFLNYTSERKSGNVKFIVQ